MTQGSLPDTCSVPDTDSFTDTASLSSKASKPAVVPRTHPSSGSKDASPNEEKRKDSYEDKGKASSSKKKAKSSASQEKEKSSSSKEKVRASASKEKLKVSSDEKGKGSFSDEKVSASASEEKVEDSFEEKEKASSFKEKVKSSASEENVKGSSEKKGQGSSYEEKGKSSSSEEKSRGSSSKHSTTTSKGRPGLLSRVTSKFTDLIQENIVKPFVRQLASFLATALYVSFGLSMLHVILAPLVTNFIGHLNPLPVLGALLPTTISACAIPWIWMVMNCSPEVYIDWDANKSTNPVVTTSDLIAQASRMASQGTDSTMELSIYFDFVGVLQAAITEASLPDPEPLLGAVKKLDMDATDLFSVLRAFFPTMRNTVWAVKADLTSAKKRMSQIRRDYFRSWFYSSGSSLDPRAIDEIEKVMVHLFGTIERKMVHVRAEAEVSLTKLAEVKKDLEQVDKSLKQNKDRSEQVKADKSEIFLGRWKFKGELLTVENSLRIMDSINVMVAGVKNTVAELNSLINQAVSDVKGFMVLTGQPVHLPFGEASLDTLFDSIDMAIECLDQSIMAPPALGRGSPRHKLLYG